MRLLDSFLLTLFLRYSDTLRPDILYKAQLTHYMSWQLQQGYQLLCVAFIIWVQNITIIIMTITWVQNTYKPIWLFNFLPWMIKHLKDFLKSSKIFYSKITTFKIPLLLVPLFMPKTWDILWIFLSLNSYFQQIDTIVGISEKKSKSDYL